MKKPLVSILIPVYNVEEYLPKCLESVMEQTLTNIEIICVNDGSTDGSAGILEEYRRRDSRIKVVTKENGGLPSARNAGLDCANGKYVGFVDSDDFVEKNMFQKLVETAEKDKADIVICGADILPEEPRANEWLYQCLSPTYHKYEEYDPEILYTRGDTTPFLWRTLIRKDIIDRHSFRLDEDILIGEDKAFQCKVFPEAERITVIPDKLYHYYWCRSDSLMGKQVYGNFENRILAHAKLVERIGRDLGKKEFEKKSCQSFHEWSIPFIYDDFIYLQLNEKCEVAKQLMPMWRDNGIFRFINALPDWKREAFDYIRKFENVNVDGICTELSIIIPVEYSSRYVEDMIKMLQTIVDDRIEIIIVNNGMSNENYVRIQNFLYQNQQVRLFNTPTHSSYAKALNTGVELARGKYIGFLDTQDWYQSKANLDTWLELALKNGYDICASEYSQKKIPSNCYAKVLREDDWKKKIFELDYHNFLYRREFLIEKKIQFTEATIVTGYIFLCKAISEAMLVGHYNENVYVLREMHRADWISTEKCELALNGLNELVELSLEQQNAYLHGSVFSILNGDELKQIIVNNTKPYCMPSWQCPKGENSQINTVRSLFEIVGKADEEMLCEYGFTESDNIFLTLYEVIKQRHQFLAELSNQHIK